MIGSDASSVRRSGSSCAILPDIASAIGDTPLVDLKRLVAHHGLDGRILAKCEYLSPGSSKKDRVARQIVLDAKESGQLRPGQPVVELTSGNTGTGLAIVCGILGHPFVAVMSRGNSVERALMMRALGADVVLVDQAEGSIPGQVSGKDLELVEERTKEVVTSLGAFQADQYVRESNHRAHYLGTAPEIWRQANCDGDGSADNITAFCDFVGTGGTFGGCAAFFHPRGVRCYVVEPKGAAVLSGQVVTRPGHRIQGGGYLRSHEGLPLLKMRTGTVGDDDNNNNNEDRDGGETHLTSSSLIDGYLEVTDEEAIRATRDLAKYEGIFAGFSAGANLAAAAELLRTTEKGGTVVILICDSGLKYMSTDLWEDSCQE
jgi:cysteine synthase A